MLTRKPSLIVIAIVMGVLLPVLLTVSEVVASVDKESLLSEENRSKLSAYFLPANGRQETILQVESFGRYAVTAESLQGIALQLIDKMAGPGVVAGIAGKEDGRLDLFLERGEYKIRTFSHEKGEGQVALKSHSFKELSTPYPPRLIDHKVINTLLEDFQQRSYWLEVKERKTVNIEAAGRNLEDFRLWKDGTWLVDAVPANDHIEPKKGKPLRVRRFTVDLQAGLYLLTAYGGKSELWAQETNEHPLYIRMGIPELTDADRRRYTASPFGIDRWKVPGDVNYYRLELKKSDDASITVDYFDENAVFSSSGSQKTINKKSRIPLAEVRVSSRDQGYRLLTIKREAAKPYILQYFKSDYIYPFEGSGQYWVSTIHSGHGEDSVDATAMLTERPRHGRERLVESSVIKLDSSTSWERRFNLLEPLTMYLEIKEGHSYIVEGEGAKAKFRIEPFLTYRPRNYKSPDFKESGEVWELDPGYYVLEATPGGKGKGILNLKIYPKRSAIVQGLINLKKVAGNYLNTSDKSQFKGVPAQTHIRFQSVSLNRTSAYNLYKNRQPEVSSGVVLRKLPVDLGRSLPVTLAVGETILLPIRIPEEGTLSATSEDGSLLGMSLDDGKWKDVHLVKYGNYKLRIRNKTKSIINLSLSLTPTRFVDDIPLPQLASQPDLPAFPVLERKKPHFLDAEKGEAKTFKVKVDTPGLYRLETTGLLQTEGNIRTRTNPSLFKESNNGIGRNFLVQQYLREGDYQLTVKPEGETEGHFGLRLSQSKLHDGGILSNNIPARYSLPAGEGLVYRFDIKEKGSYNLKSLGLNRNFLVRLDDVEGWPLIMPGTPAGLSMELEPGTYRYTILPKPVESRVVTLLKRASVPRKYEGHGPHNIFLNQSVRHRWMEPEEGLTRTPDKWSFFVPASVNIEIKLKDDMEAILFYIDDSGKESKKESFSGRQDWKGLLRKGSYRLDIKSTKPNNLFDYSLSVLAEELVKGQQKSVRAPGEIIVAVGEDSLIELSSFGNNDIKARLFDSSGKLLGLSDDRPDDWNFHIAKKLVPGHYRLKIEPVASSSAFTTVSMYLPEEVRDSPISFPADISFNDSALHYYPLKVSAADNLLLFSVISDDAAGVALEQEKAGRWVTLGSSMGRYPVLAVPSNKGSNNKKYRLRIWSVDRRGGTVKLQARAISIPAETEKTLTKNGVALNPVKDIDMAIGVAAIDIEKPGLFKIERDIGSLVWATERGQGLSGNGSGLISAGSRRLWLLDRLPNNLPVTVKVKRLILNDGKKLKCDTPWEKDLVINHHSKTDSPTILLVDSQMGQPGISFGNNKKEAAANFQRMGIAAQSAVAVKLKQDGSPARVWNAGSPGAPLPLTASQFSFDKIFSKGKLKFGLKNLVLNQKIGYQYKLPSGGKKITIAISELTVAVFSKKGKILKTIWTGKKSTHNELFNDADTLHLFNIGSKKAYGVISFTAVKSVDSYSSVDSSKIFKRHFSSSGVVHSRIKLKGHEKNSGITLNISGYETEGLVLDKNGKIQRGQELFIKDDSLLSIKHGPGLVTAWLSSGMDYGVSIDTGRRAIKVNPPEQVSLKGDSVLLKFEQDAASHLTLKTNVPVTAKFKTGARQSAVKVFPHGANISLYLPEGVSFVSLNSTGYGDLHGSAEVITSKITEITEGLGPKMLLSPGGAKMFTFDLKSKGPVGVGVKASADIISCNVFDIKGSLIGKGVVQMHDLTPGKYIMEVYSPADGETVEIQPAVVGIIPPDTGPPEKVIRKYLDMAGLKLKGNGDAR